MALYDKQQQFFMAYETRETTYGTPLAVDRELRVVPTPVVPMSERISDEAYTGGGKEGPTDEMLVRSWFTWSPRFEHVRADDLAAWLAYTVGPVAGAVEDTSAFHHGFSLSAAHALPSISMEWLRKSGLQKKYGGGVVQRLSVEWERNRPLVLSPEVIFATEGAGTGAPALSTETPKCNGAGTNAWTSTAPEASYTPELGASDLLATVADIAAELVAFRYSIQNVRDPRMLYDGQSSAPNTPNRSDRMLTLDVTLETDDHTNFDRIQDMSQIALEWEWDSGVKVGAIDQNIGAQFVWPAVRMLSVGEQFDAHGRLRQRFTCQLFEDANLGRWQGSVWNTVAAYAAAA